MTNTIQMMKRRYLPIVFLMVPLIAFAQGRKNRNLEVAKNLDIFNEVYQNLDMLYVDTLNANELVGTGIKAMLRSLDPYTEYYPESETGSLKMMLTGKYAGVGALIRYHQKLKRVVIDEPYEGMPAAEVGLKKGDIVLSIDDSLMTDKDVSYVSNRLRGDAGTKFVLKVLRPSTGKKMDFKITRRAIKLPELPYYGILPTTDPPEREGRLITLKADYPNSPPLREGLGWVYRLYQPEPVYGGLCP